MNDRPHGVAREARRMFSPVAQQTVDRYIRLFGCSVFAILATAYVTGAEETPHTHQMIGYGIAVLLVAALTWELIRFRDNQGSASLSPRPTSPPSGLEPAVIWLLITLPILAVLAGVALVLMLITHNYWGATLVDEMHEVVAYFGLGLIVVYVMSLLVRALGSLRS